MIVRLHRLFLMTNHRHVYIQSLNKSFIVPFNICFSKNIYSVCSEFYLVFPNCFFLAPTLRHPAVLFLCNFKTLCCMFQIGINANKNTIAALDQAGYVKIGCGELEYNFLLEYLHIKRLFVKRILICTSSKTCRKLGKKHSQN